MGPATEATMSADHVKSICEVISQQQVGGSWLPLNAQGEGAVQVYLGKPIELGRQKVFSVIVPFGLSFGTGRIMCDIGAEAPLKVRVPEAVIEQVRAAMGRALS